MKEAFLKYDVATHGSNPQAGRLRATIPGDTRTTDGLVANRQSHLFSVYLVLGIGLLSFILGQGEGL